MSDITTHLVVGGAGLLGQSIVKALAKLGARVFVAELELAKAEKLVAELKHNSGELIPCAMDICNKSSILDVISLAESRGVAIESVVNCAYPRNVNYGREFFDVEFDDFCENSSLHLGGYFLLAQQFSQYFMSKKAGNIINVASIYGVVAPRFDIYEQQAFTMPVEYAAIKSAIIHLTKYIASYIKGSGVRVNCISPGGIYNGQPESFCNAYKQYCNGIGMLDVEMVTSTALYLLSEQSRAINGQNLIVDDGFTL